MSEAQPEHASPADEGVDTSALEQSEESISAARDALAGVAANDDVTTDDEAEEGSAGHGPEA